MEWGLITSILQVRKVSQIKSLGQGALAHRRQGWDRDQDQIGTRLVFLLLDYLALSPNEIGAGRGQALLALGAVETSNHPPPSELPNYLDPTCGCPDGTQNLDKQGNSLGLESGGPNNLLHPSVPQFLLYRVGTMAEVLAG